MIDFLHSFPFPFRDRSSKRQKRKSAGQSLVELAIALPIIILLFSGLVEFGFILNYYLSLLDATREAARFYSNANAFNADHTENMDFYQGAAEMALSNLQPRDLGQPEVKDNTRKIILDPNADDIVVVVLDVAGEGITRYPSAGDYHYFGNHESGLKNDAISSQLVEDAPDTAILLVEVFYNYHQVLALPWLTVFVPDPVLLHAYTMFPMPTSSVGRQPVLPQCSQLPALSLECSQFAFFPTGIIAPLRMAAPISPQLR